MVQPEEQVARRSAARAATFRALQLLLDGLSSLDGHEYARFEAALIAADRTLNEQVRDLTANGSLGG